MINSTSNKGSGLDLKRTRRRKPALSSVPKVDRLPPHSIECEIGVLGCVILSPALMDECVEKLKGCTDAFYDLRHQTIFEALISMRKAGENIDTITLQQWLKDDGFLEQVGGIAYLASLPDAVPSTANLSYYLNHVADKYRLRKIIHTCTDIVARVYDSKDDVDLLCDTVRRDMERVFEVDTRAKCQRFRVSDLDNFDLDNDKDNLVGNRYLTRGSSLIINGASGRGKSSLLMLRIILWALGEAFYGMKVVRPLSAVIWQTENNQGDLAKAFQGARNFLKLNSLEHEEQFELMERNIEFVYCPALCGREFLSFAESELTKNPRDLAVLDPLVSFPEDDLNGQKGAAEFLRKGLSKISFITGATWIINHHTPKPLRDPKNNKAKKNLSDYQYGGAGSFDIPGWARSVETLEESQDGIFRLVLAKRGFEAGATHPDGTRTSMLWLRHALEGGIHWEQMEPPEEAESDERKEKPLTKPQQIASLNLGTFVSKCESDGETLRGLIKRLTTWLASKDCPKKSLAQTSFGSLNTAVGLLLENEKLEMKDNLYFKGPKA